MQILKSLPHETVWGGRKLKQFCDSNSNNIGHLYSCIDTKNFKSPIIYGSFKNKNIHDWFEAKKEKFSLSQYTELPVLMALVEAADNLSIQVHPDDFMANELLNLPFGKNESFYIIEPPTSGFMFNGCLVDSRDAMADLIENGRCMDGVDTLPLSVGSYVYVTGGTLHAATRGSLSFEIEENCDATFRFYDFDRVDKDGKRRPLQITNALRCLNVKNKSTVKFYQPGSPIVERLYSTQLIKNQSFVKNTDSSTFTILVLLKGIKEFDGIVIYPGTAVILEDLDMFDTSSLEWMKVNINI